MDLPSSKTITIKNCHALTGYSWEDLLSLSGVFGFHTKDEILNEKAIRYLRCKLHDNIVEIDIETSLVGELWVYVYLSPKKFITNNKFSSIRSGGGLGFKKVRAQVEAAKRLNFNWLHLTAAGSPETRDTLKGYMIWGKYGYLMNDHTEKLRFRRLMKQESRKDKILYDLQSDIPSGEELWVNKGFEWAGIFYLIPTSKKNSVPKSLKILREASKKRGLSPSF